MLTEVATFKLGSLLVPRLTTPWSTYTVLFLLLAGHLITNFIAVRGIVLRSLNRQRAGIAWTIYRAQDFAGSDHRLPDQLQKGILTPKEVASRERIFEYSGVLRNGCTGKIMGHCSIGSSPSSVLPNDASYDRLLRTFLKDRYILCFDPHWVLGGHLRRSRPVRMHICLKEGHTYLDQLKAWAHAEELGRVWTERLSENEDDLAVMIESTYRLTDAHFPAFIERMSQVGWRLDEGTLMTSAPKAIMVSADGGSLEWNNNLQLEGKKDI